MERVNVLDSAIEQSVAAGCEGVNKHGCWRAFRARVQTKLLRECSSRLFFGKILRYRDFLPGRRAPNLPRRTGEDHIPIGTPTGRDKN